MTGSLHIVHVQVKVAEGQGDAFVEASRANARASRQEKGVVRFDVLRDADDPARFALVEIYRDAAAAAAHKQTAHYAAWRDAVAPMMAEPRTSRRFVNVDPGDDGF